MKVSRHLEILTHPFREEDSFGWHVQQLLFGHDPFPCGIVYFQLLSDSGFRFCHLCHLSPLLSLPFIDLSSYQSIMHLFSFYPTCLSQLFHFPASFGYCHGLITGTPPTLGSLRLVVSSCHSSHYSKVVFPNFPPVVKRVKSTLFGK